MFTHATFKLANEILHTFRRPDGITLNIVIDWWWWWAQHLLAFACTANALCQLANSSVGVCCRLYIQLYRTSSEFFWFTFSKSIARLHEQCSLSIIVSNLNIISATRMLVFFLLKIEICFQIKGIRTNVIFTGCNLQVKDPFKTPSNDAQKMKMIDSNGCEWKLKSHATFHVMNNFVFRGGIHCNQQVQWLVIQCSNKIGYEQFTSTK